MKNKTKLFLLVITFFSFFVIGLFSFQLIRFKNSLESALGCKIGGSLLLIKPFSKKQKFSKINFIQEESIMFVNNFTVTSKLPVLFFRGKKDFTDIYIHTNSPISIKSEKDSLYFNVESHKSKREGSSVSQTPLYCDEIFKNFKLVTIEIPRFSYIGTPDKKGLCGTYIGEQDLIFKKNNNCFFYYFYSPSLEKTEKSRINEKPEGFLYFFEEASVSEPEKKTNIVEFYGKPAKECFKKNNLDLLYFIYHQSGPLGYSLDNLHCKIIDNSTIILKQEDSTIIERKNFINNKKIPLYNESLTINIRGKFPEEYSSLEDINFMKVYSGEIEGGTTIDLIEKFGKKSYKLNNANNTVLELFNIELPDGLEIVRGDNISFSLYCDKFIDGNKTFQIEKKESHIGESYFIYETDNYILSLEDNPAYEIFIDNNEVFINSKNMASFTTKNNHPHYGNLIQSNDPSDAMENYGTEEDAISVSKQKHVLRISVYPVLENKLQKFIFKERFLLPFFLFERDSVLHAHLPRGRNRRIRKGSVYIGGYFIFKDKNLYETYIDLSNLEKKLKKFSFLKTENQQEKTEEESSFIRIKRMDDFYDDGLERGAVLETLINFCNRNAKITFDNEGGQGKIFEEIYSTVKDTDLEGDNSNDNNKEIYEYNIFIDEKNSIINIESKISTSLDIVNITLMIYWVLSSFFCFGPYGVNLKIENLKILGKEMKNLNSNYDFNRNGKRLIETNWNLK